jgi:SPW repeat
MAVRAGVSLPKQWEDWASWAFGIWLCISPWALEFDLERVPTRNAVIVGCLIILAEVVTLSVFRPWEEWINVALGAWLVISPWVLGIASTAATVNFVVIGALVVALAFYEMRSVERET